MNIIVEELEKTNIGEFMIWFHGLYTKYENVKRIGIYFVKESETMLYYDNLYYVKFPDLSIVLSKNIERIIFLAKNEIEKGNNVEATTYYYNCPQRGALINVVISTIKGYFQHIKEI